MSKIDPAQPLNNRRWEAFAQAKARGATHADAWRAGVPLGAKHGGGDRALKSAASKALKQHPQIQARIDYLRVELRNAATPVEEEISSASVIALMTEVSDSLGEAYRRAVALNVADTKLEALRRVMSMVTGRMARLDEAALPDPVPDAPELKPLGGCTCQH